MPRTAQALRCLIKTKSFTISQLIVALCFVVLRFLDLLLVIFFNIVEILVIFVFTLLAGFSLSLGPFFLILGVLHFLLSLLGDSPQRLTGSLGLSGVVGDHHVVDLWVHPGALVVGVVNLPWLPLSLVLGVIDHRRLPLSVH